MPETNPRLKKGKSAAQAKGKSTPQERQISGLCERRINAYAYGESSIRIRHSPLAGVDYPLAESKIKNRAGRIACAISILRSDRDSNSGAAFDDYTLSRRASSATRASLLN